MNFRSKIALIILIQFMFFNYHANARDLEANIFVLIDFSGSYFTKERVDKRIPDNFDQLATALTSKRNGPKRPALFQVLPINSTSQSSAPMCEYKYLQKSLLMSSANKNCGSTKDEFCSHKGKLFKDYINNECLKLIVSETIDPNTYTDISGALALSGQLAKSQPADDNYLIIMSDMFEFRYDELPVSNIDLSNFNIFVVCGGEFNNENNITKLCMDTEESWSRKFKDLGASNVIFTIETGNWGDGAIKDLF